MIKAISKYNFNLLTIRLEIITFIYFLNFESNNIEKAYNEVRN